MDVKRMSCYDVGVTPEEFLCTKMQHCFCWENHTQASALPLANHKYGCLVWDWAMHEKKITPSHRMRQLDQHAKDIGDAEQNQ